LLLWLGGLLGHAQVRHVSLLTNALHGTHATAVIVDVPSGSILDSYGALDMQAAPGSTLKPFVLKAALDADVISAQETIHCHGSLMVKGHNLACGHPREITVLDARQALAESCNTYFVTLARQMTSQVLMKGLQAYGLHPAGSAAVPDDRALLAVGIVGIKTSPRELALAYRRLAQQMNGATGHAVAVVRDGMLQSVETGMAHGAQTDGVRIGGKTGTAQDAPATWSHGWFVGILFDGQMQAQRVLVIYVPSGTGNDAALLAKRVLQRKAVQ
jgi:peptidoglycan glycosyltransferase